MISEFIPVICGDRTLVELMLLRYAYVNGFSKRGVMNSMCFWVVLFFSRDPVRADNKISLS